jgi:hypothetical protein
MRRGQNNGYKDGRYIKIWADREDNMHLVELASGLDLKAADFKTQLCQRLEARYSSCVLTLSPNDEASPLSG